jgi:uncharacterized protein YkwD
MISGENLDNIARVSLWVLILTIGFGTVRAAAQVPVIDEEEEIMLSLINNFREQNGKSRLKVSISLTRAADWMSTDMAANNYFSHTDSMGRSPMKRMVAFKYTDRGYRGENLAAGHHDALSTFTQWIESLSHKQNMLRSQYNVIGISRVYSEKSPHKWYWTTDFGSHLDTILTSSSTTVQNSGAGSN